MSSFSFSDDLKKFAEKADPGVVVRKVALDVFGRVILRTPVDTGRARANWQTTIGAPAGEELDTVNKIPVGVPGGSADLERALIIDQHKGDESIFLTNNLPYIEVLENGSSGQSPAGMVKVTLAEYPHIVEDAVNK